MKVGILGSKDVGQALARGIARHGHEVMIGTREPKKLEAFAKQAKVKVGSFAEAAKHGDVVILAVKGEVAEAAVGLAGPTSFGEKLVLDATNPLDFSKGMPPGLLLGTTDSLGERVQKMIPRAKVVKCFNTVPNSVMVDPAFKENVPMLICGNDAEAKKRTEAFLKSLGWPGVLDVGGIDGARWLEALVPLWVRAGAALDLFGKGSWAFKVVVK